MTTPPPDTPRSDYTNAPAGNVHDTFARPAIVTAVAALGLIWGGLTIASSLVSTVLLNSTAGACAPNDHSGLCAFVADSSGRLIVIGNALLVGLSEIWFIWPGWRWSAGRAV